MTQQLVVINSAALDEISGRPIAETCVFLHMGHLANILALLIDYYLNINK